MTRERTACPMTKRYILTASDYNSALRMLRRFRRRGVKLVCLVMVVECDHWNRVKDFAKNSPNQLILVFSQR